MISRESNVCIRRQLSAAMRSRPRTSRPIRKPCGNPVLTPFGTSAPPPPCPAPACYPDYFAATAGIAIDSTGHMVLSYTFNEVANGPKSLFVQTSYS